MTFLEQYNDFIAKMESGTPIEGAEVGQLIAKMAQYFANEKQNEAKSEYTYSKKLVEFEKQTDDNGKALSSAKAEAFAKATPEYEALITAEARVASIEQIINALKSLQRGVLNEFAYAGNQ
jgi:hypothetical protein